MSLINKYSTMNVKELKSAAKLAGLTGYSKLKKINLIEELLKNDTVVKKGLNRMDFTRPKKGGGKLKNMKKTDNNKEILSKGHKSFNNVEIIEKFNGYNEVDTADVRPGNNGWYRYFIYNKKTNKYEFKSGGFVLTNKSADKFISMFNRSQNYSWSVQKEVSGKPTIFFRNGSKVNFSSEFNNVLNTQFNNKLPVKGRLGFIVLNKNDNYKPVYYNRINNIVVDTDGSEIGIRKALREKRNLYKGFYITRGDRGKFDKINELLENVDPEEEVDNEPIVRRINKILSL